MSLYNDRFLCAFNVVLLYIILDNYLSAQRSRVNALSCSLFSSSDSSYNSNRNTCSFALEDDECVWCFPQAVLCVKDMCLSGRNFEALANGILDHCWSKDRQYTSDMLVRVAPNWGNSTVLSMAYDNEMEEFLAQPACYTKLNKIWRGDIALRTNIFWVSFQYDLTHSQSYWLQVTTTLHV